MIERKLELLRDSKHEDDINMLLDNLTPLLVNFFAAFEASISKIIYDSTKNFGEKTVINFEIQSKKRFPILTLEISQLGSGYLPPSRRSISAVTSFNADRKIKDFIYTTYGLSSLIMLGRDNNREIKQEEKLKLLLDDIKIKSIEFLDLVDAIALFDF